MSVWGCSGPRQWYVCRRAFLPGLSPRFWVGIRTEKIRRAIAAAIRADSSGAYGGTEAWSFGPWTSSRAVPTGCSWHYTLYLSTFFSHGLPEWPRGKASPCQCRRCGFHRFRKMPWRRKRQPTPVFFLGNPIDRGAWWATVQRVTKRWTWLHD